MSDSTKFIEDNYEMAIISLFEEMGYEYVCGSEVERDDIREPWIKSTLASSLRKINPDLPDEAYDVLIGKVTRIYVGSLEQNNQRFMDYLQNGVIVEYTDADGKRQFAIAQLIDYVHPQNNTLQVINQWVVEEFKRKRCDIVVMVNGLPLVVIELKSATAVGATIDDAYRQIRNYQQCVPSLFTFNAFNVISDMCQSRVGTITAKMPRYMEWKTEEGDYETTLVADYKTFFRGLFKPTRFLDIIKNFICFDASQGTLSKVMTAYHQYYGVNKASQRAMTAVNSDGKIGVFWHTQGSGKSFSMVFFAHQLIMRLPQVTIVVVTDRTDLDNQLFQQFGRCEDFLRQKAVRAESKASLARLLKDRKAGGIIFTTIQKFDESDECLSDRRNIVVITDEAHRSQYGDERWDSKSLSIKKGQARKMREALPNASFIGFTGTPISDRDRDTREVFGDYIDVYDMTQAVNDGATRPVYYESRVINLKLDEDTLKALDTEFETLVQMGASDEQIRDAQRRNARLEALLGSREAIASLVDDILDHYENNRAQECTGKAMIVALTRRIAIKIYKRIMELRPEWTEKVRVVMSDNNKDPEEWQTIIGNDVTRKELAKRFKDDEDPLKIVIVRDMWLTGFDVPSLATMYVYKAMKGHNLMQAIARVNRVFPEKEGGLIVDYIGIAQSLREAMNQYTKRDQHNFGDPNIAKTAKVKWQELMEQCRDILHGFDYKPFFGNSNKNKAEVIMAGANFLSSIAKESEKKDFIEFSNELHKATTLCRSLLTTAEKVEVCCFDSIRCLLLKLAQTGKISKQEINDRISSLIQQSIKSEGVINLFSSQDKDFSLFDPTFLDELKSMKQKNLALDLLKRLLREKIKKESKYNVIKSDKYSELMNCVLSQYIKGLLTNEEVIAELIKLAERIKTEENDGASLGLTVEEKAFYDALSTPEGVRKVYSDEEFIALTRELTEMLHKNKTIDWSQRKNAQAGMRVMVKRLLRKYKYPPEGAEEALQTVMRQCESWANDEENYNEE